MALGILQHHDAVAGTANTDGRGGGGTSNTPNNAVSAAGGSGVVILKYTRASVGG